MNTERIKEIQAETGYPDSVSVQQALLKVWNECEQDKVKNCNTTAVSKCEGNSVRELLFAFLKANENLRIPDYDSNKHLMIDAFLGKQ